MRYLIFLFLASTLMLSYSCQVKSEKKVDKETAKNEIAAAEKAFEKWRLRKV
ncbi:MAG: hypothetical protein WDN26_04735 [Chitinophagaceae bacterium]